ncbi:NAD(P)H-binding protein [Pediococcus siamensis]|uniref:NAD(P)H-binding protein n=1 Tax=Pediococcus siamensis TaxID=381829 RepID=UPI0039A040FA
MRKVIILGAAGHIARLAAKQLISETDDQLTLFVRHPKKLTDVNEKRETIVVGDVNNETELTAALKGQDIVYANLGPDNTDQMVPHIVKAMHTAGLKRLIWISTLGVFNEVPGKFGEWNKQMLNPSGYLPTQSKAAEEIEASDLDYTIVRPNWLTDKNEVDYETTGRHDAMKGTEVSRQSVADYVVKLLQNPTKDVRTSVGLNKPHTDGDKPSFY